MGDDEEQTNRALNMLNDGMTAALADLAQHTTYPEGTLEFEQLKAGLEHLFVTRVINHLTRELECDGCLKSLATCECQYDQSLQAIQTLFM